jgi:hypothetical protein
VTRRSAELQADGDQAEISPMVHVRPVALFVAVIAVGAGLASSTSAGAASSQPKPLVLTADQAPGALLTLDDLPSDWIVTPSSSERGHGFCGSPDALGRAQAAGVVTNAIVDFAGDQNRGPFVENRLYGFPASDGAKQFVQATARALIPCRHADRTEADGATTSIDYSFLKLAQLGDGVFAYHSAVSTTLGDQHDDSITDVAYLRRGTVVSVVALTASNSSPELLTEFLRAARRRIAIASKKAAAGTTVTTVPSMTSPEVCARAVATMTAPAPGGGPDPVEILQSGALVLMPVPEGPSPPFIAASRYTIVDAYLRDNRVPDGATWRDALTRDGFAIAEANLYDGPSGTARAEAMQFGSPEQAADFQQRTLKATCASGTVAHIEIPTDLPAAAIVRVTQRGLTPYQASIVVGSKVVRFVVCGCVENGDYFELLHSWARAVVKQLSATPA